MNLRLLATSTLAGLLLIGCSEQSSVNSPAASIPTHHSATAKTTGGISTSVTLDVDAVVVDEKTGISFSVTGSIACDLSKDQTSYTFLSQPSLTVTSQPDGKDLRSTVAANDADTGTAAPEVIVSKEYKLADFPTGSVLRIQYSLTDNASISSMSITLGGEDVGIEAK